MKKRSLHFFNHRAGGPMSHGVRFGSYEVQAKATNAAPSGDESPLGAKVSIDIFELA